MRTTSYGFVTKTKAAVYVYFYQKCVSTVNVIGRKNLVSVVIPCFNVEKTIRDTIDSVLSQNYSSLEIIVVDDGSTDSSFEIISSYGDALQLVSGPNRGVSSARNIGTDLARGEFIQYLDSDDLLANDTIQHRVDALINNDADVVYTDWQKFERVSDGSLRYMQKIQCTLESIDSDPEIACATRFWAPPAAILYRMSIVAAIGSWNETLPVIQDARFIFDAAYNEASFIRVPEIGAYYRVSESGSLSERNKREFLLDVERNADQIKVLWKRRAGLSQAQKTALGEIYDYVAREMFMEDEHQYRIVLRKLRKSKVSRRLGYTYVSGVLDDYFGIHMARKMMKIILRFKRIVH